MSPRLTGLVGILGFFETFQTNGIRFRFKASSDCCKAKAYSFFLAIYLKKYTYTAM